MEPLGSNHWAQVAAKFSEWSAANERPVRDQDSLKNKFDKLANAKKKTGNPSCPPDVSRAKHIARNIQNKCAAGVPGSDENEEGHHEENETNSITGGGRWETVDESESVGARHGKRRHGASSTPGSSKRSRPESFDFEIAENVGKMTEHLGNLPRAFTAEPSLTEENVKQVIKREVDESLWPTNELLKEMALLLQTLSQRSAVGSQEQHGQSNGE